MSHIVEATTSITNPDQTLLRQAVELVAQANQGTVKDHYLSYRGKKQQVNTNLAIFTPRLQRGIGIRLGENGELRVVGDPFMVEELFKQVQQQIVQMYVSLASIRALQEMGYQTQAQDSEEGRVVIQGVSYA